jgi:hypothetical protein
LHCKTRKIRHANKGYNVSRRLPLIQASRDGGSEVKDAKVEKDSPRDELEGMRRPWPTVGTTAWFKVHCRCFWTLFLISKLGGTHL